MQKLYWNIQSVIIHLILTDYVGVYPYNVTLSTVKQSDTNTESQHFLSDYHAFPANDNFLKFRVLGKQGARLVFESTKKDSPQKRIFYYILIGNLANTRSAILLVNDTLSGNNFFKVHRNADASGTVLSETEWREFWISWCSGTIKVGKGPEYNKDLMMSWTNPCPFKVVDIGISSGEQLSWEFMFYSPENNVESRPPKGNCNSYIRTSDCLMFKPIASLAVSRFECVWQCSDLDDCWAWDYNAVNGTCKLFSGEAEQVALMDQESSALFYKKQDE